MNRVLLLIYIFIFSLGFSSDLTTLSIKGDITVTYEDITGDFSYQLHNTTSTPKSEWTFLIHPSVNILAVSHNNTQAKIDIQHGINYRIITVKLSRELLPNTRDSVFVRFYIDSQLDNPRMTISPEHIFLDARQFWFPYPIKDDKIDFEFTIRTPLNLHGVMGGRLTSEAIIVDRKISTWKNELKSLSPGATLVVTKIPSVSKNNIFIYSDNKKFQQTVMNGFTPFWNIFQKEYRYVPLSQIHIIPTEIYIPNSTNHGAEGEFLGNIFLVSDSLIDAINNDDYPFKNWDSSDEQLIEILIHELHHGFFPGLAKHDSQDLIFMESLVQTLTWDIIKRISPELSKKMQARTRFYLQNFAINNQYDYLWEFLWNIGLLYNAMHSANISGQTLVDTLIEKYRYSGYTKHDVFDTIYQHKQQFSTKIDYDSTIFENYQISNLNLFDSEIQTSKTNFVITVTNTSLFKRMSIMESLVDATTLSMSHNFPFTWSGQLFWVDDTNTNYINITIPQNETWETNLIGNIQTLYTESPLDVFELNLSNNYILQDNIGEKLIHSLNTGSNKTDTQNIRLMELSQEKLNIIKNSNLKLIWDSTMTIEEDLLLINAFVVSDDNVVKFVSLPTKIYNNQYIIYNILDQ